MFGLQPLALVALATREVHRVTGCDLEKGLLFLLCDLPCGNSFRFSLSIDGGLRIWAYDPLMTAGELYGEYVAFRRSYGPRNRPKHPQEHTRELIRFVQELRPQGGRHVDSAPWRQVLERWNAEHPRKHRYADPASISRAYTATLKRRKELNAL